MFPSYLTRCGNTIFWLPFSPQITRLQDLLPFYYSLLVFEAISLIVSLVCIVTLLVVFWKHQIVHLNLTLMIIFHGVLCLVSMLLRFLQMLYEIGWITLVSPGCPPVPQIVIVRIMSYISLVLLLGGIVIERSFATYYVIDYEKKKRSWIAIVITSVLLVISYCISSQIVKGGLNGIFSAASMVVPVAISIFAFRLLLRRNKRRLARLTDMIEQRSGTDKYSLSLRLQLRENIWTMQKLNRMVTGSVPIALLVLPFYFLPPFFLRDEPNWRVLELVTECVNAVLATLTPLCTALIVIIFEQVRLLLLPKRMTKGRKK
ncbi:hypothetical protein PFISCL1PPCAC_7310 [Pristionchus fissidentatus]|uniref:G protein-coupled receptor n=1 Tax=Pristionchus fissidentatus TaxID=1538716 RepID=A0AAV5VCU3_9BILA|nr:hypothetical protein PFISCL1PPCAC_7310 [Pristionchus fissidentatus]